MIATSCMQRGQTLPLALLLVAAAAVSWVYLYNGGHIVAARTRLTHAADAVAYSGALIQARALNMQAYINRAQVAHQVAMAHLVTLSAWQQAGTAQAGQAARGNPPASLIAMLFGPAYGSAYASSRRAGALGGLAGDLERAYDGHDRSVRRILQASARTLIDTLPAVRERAMRAVLSENYRDAGQALPAAMPRLDWLGDGLPGRLAMAAPSQAELPDLTLQAAGRYGFLAPRDATARNAWPVSHRCPQLRHELRRRGATTLDANGRWQARDTLSFHALRSNRWIGCYYREYPMGWGDTAAGGGGAQEAPGVDAPDDFSAQDFWRWVRQYTDWDIQSPGSGNALARARAASARRHWAGRGFPGYATLTGPAASPLRLAIALRMPAAALQTSDAAGTVRVAGRRFGFRALAPGEYVHAASAAETFFARPQPRADGRDEMAGLFHPYWQARLAALLPHERRIAGGLRD